MVQGYYSLDEAAKVLGMAVDELNQMARERKIRAFADSGSWKFRQQDIEELRRTRQFGSDPEIRLADTPFSGGSADILDDDEDHVLSSDQPPRIASSDSAATIIGMKGTPRDSESDVRLELASDASGSDSDIRLVPDSSSGSLPEIDDDMLPIGEDVIRAPSDSDIRMTFEDSAMAPKKTVREAMDRTEEIELGDASEVPILPTSGKSKSDSREKASASSKGEDNFNLDDDLDGGFRLEGEEDLGVFDDSKFEVPVAKGKKDDSGSENDLSLGSDDIRLEDDSDFVLDDVSPKLSGSDSGINLSKPNDSGISLEPDDDASDSEFEVSLDTEDSDLFGSEDLPAFKDDSSPKLGGGKGKPAAKGKAKDDDEDSTEDTGPSDSDFELSIDDEFEVEEESGSEVIALDDEEDEEDEEEEDIDFEDEEDAPRPAARQPKQVVVAAVSAPWPNWLAPVLAVNTLVLALVGIMMYEVMRNAWSHQSPYSMSATVINQVNELAKMIGIGS